MIKLCKDILEAAAPTGASFAFIHIAEVESLTRILCLIIGAVCTILITIAKLKHKNHER